MFTIGRLAKRARVKIDSVRFYERQGLVAPTTKTPSGYRLYTDAAVRRIAFIKHAQRCGLSLAEISKLLQLHQANAAGRKAAYRLAAEKRSEIEKTIAALQAMSAALSSVLAADVDETLPPAADTEESPLLAALETCVCEERSSRAAAATLHASAARTEHQLHP